MARPQQQYKIYPLILAEVLIKTRFRFKTGSDSKNHILILKAISQFGVLDIPNVTKKILSQTDYFQF